MLEGSLYLLRGLAYGGPEPARALHEAGHRDQDGRVSKYRLTKYRLTKYRLTRITSFLHHPSKYRLPRAKMARITPCFPPQDGRVSEAELRAGLERMHMPMSAVDIETVMRIVDR